MFFSDFLIAGGVVVSERTWSTIQLRHSNRSLCTVLERMETEGSGVVDLSSGARLEVRRGLLVGAASSGHQDRRDQPYCFAIGEPRKESIYLSVMLPPVEADACDPIRAAAIRAVVDASAWMWKPVSKEITTEICADLTGPGARLVSTCTPTDADPVLGAAAVDLAVALASSILMSRVLSAAVEQAFGSTQVGWIQQG